MAGKKKKNRILIVAAGLLLLALLIAGVYELLLPPGAAFSERENRMLAEKPAFSWRAFFDGSFADDLEKYLADRFPGRIGFIDFTRDLRQVGSLATWEDYARVAESDVAVMDIQEEELEAVTVTPRPTRTPGPTGSPTPAPRTTPEETQRPESTPAPTATPEPTATPRPTKPPADVNAFPQVVNLYMLDGSERISLAHMSRHQMMDWVKLLNAYASLLPPEGMLLVTTPPNSVRASRMMTLKDPQGMVSEFEPFLEAMTVDNVAAVTGADLLSEHLLAGDYVYFRTDRHWTPYGAYLVTARMMALVGRTVPPYESFSKQQEYPFLGNIYRDTHNRQLESTPDTLDILTPSHPVRVTRYRDKTTSREVPFIDWNADARDRYTVYLGGPSGRLSVIERTDLPEGSEYSTCLLITDSFGLSSVPFLIESYDRVLLDDPRYYDPFSIGHISEHIEAYGVQDIYFIADTGSFCGGTFLSVCNRQF